MMQQQDGAEEAQRQADEHLAYVHAAAVKIPKFYEWNSTLWFQTIEASFNVAAITTERTRLNHVLAGLDQ